MKILLAACALALVGSAASAQDLCEEMWAERNAIYADAGYCFATERGKAAFGNQGCRFRSMADVPLSARNRADIAAIQRREAAAGCPR